jgi:hypothetical protein
MDLGSSYHLGAEEPEALPATSPALIITNFRCKEACDDTGLACTGVERQVPAVSELSDAYAVFGADFGLATVARYTPDDGVTLAVYDSRQPC